MALIAFASALLLLPNLSMAAAKGPGNVNFFLSNTTDICARNNVQLQAPNNTAHGALCAIAPDALEVWACPAPDP